MMHLYPVAIVPLICASDQYFIQHENYSHVQRPANAHVLILKTPRKTVNALTLPSCS